MPNLIKGDDFRSGTKASACLSGLKEQCSKTVAYTTWNVDYSAIHLGDQNWFEKIRSARY